MDQDGKSIMPTQRRCCKRQKQIHPRHHPCMFEAIPSDVQAAILDFLSEPADFAALFVTNKEIHTWNSNHFPVEEKTFQIWLKGLKKTGARKEDNEFSRNFTQLLFS